MYRKNLCLFLLIMFLNACGGDRAAKTDANGNVIAGVLFVDTDSDGLSDDDELNLYFTNPESNDTDEDGLLDGEEILTYDTNATNPDTDNDGLNDGLEIKNYFTDAKNPDTDGDCLLDSFEVLNYETNATSTDTDKDGVEDGLEVYGSLTTTCISDPETLIGGVNENPAQDNLTNPDVIDALDPFNDSDGDQQSNIKELECSEGNPKNRLEFCPFITNTTGGQSLVSAGFIYVPGGFDVDGDGINEKGFWTSAYQARAKNDESIDSTEVNQIVGKFNTYVQNNFKMVNATETISEVIHGYSDETLSDTLINEAVPIARVLTLSANINPAIKKRLSGTMSVIATVSLSQYDVKDSTGNSLNLSLTLPNLKQYAQIQKLLEADKLAGGNGSTIRNGLLGIDMNVPLIDYTITIHEFGEGYKEFLRSIMQMKEGYIVVCTGCPWVRDWMGINKDRLLKNPNEVKSDGSVTARGTDSKMNVGMGVGPTKDDYGVLVRGGEVLDLTIGIVGSVSDAPNTHDGIGFRAATDYLE